MSHKPKTDGPHPRREPRFPGELTLQAVEKIFSDCSDFARRPALVGGVPGRRVTLCYINGMVRGERINDYILRPLAQSERLARAEGEEAFRLLEEGALYNLYVQRRTTLDQAAVDLTMGWCLLFFPGERDVLSFFVGTEEKRSVGEPENEPALKGARDSFVESVLTNTSLVRRRLRAPELKVRQHIVGRQSLTPAMVVYLDGIADPEVVRRMEEKLDAIDIDGVEAAGNLEEYLAPSVRTAFPLLPYTQRPDRFCQGLLEGRVGLLCDGLPLGWLAPGTVDQFFKTGQDRAYHWLAASALSLIRYFCALLTLLVPGLYIALVTFHPEAIPVKLALSIVAAKQEVPFSTIFEVLIMLLANAAVEAHIVSPAVLIAVAIAGVAGYTQPSQDFGNALRLWRFLLAILASLAGVFGLAAGCAGLIYHLASLESFGVPYLAPFTTGARVTRGHPSLFRLPLGAIKWRDGAGNTRNRRNQK